MTATNTSDYPRTFDVTGPLSVSIELGSGDVVVTAADKSSQAAVTLRPARPGDPDALDLINRSHVDLRGSALRIDVPRTIGFRQHPDVIVDATVPSGSAVAAKTGSAGIRLEGEFADTEIQSGSGDVWVESSSEVSAGTGSGDVRLGVVQSAAVKTGSGHITVEESQGNLTLGTGSGGIRVATIGGDAELTTASGDIDVTTSAGTGHAASLGSGHGIGLDVTHRVAAKTASGDVTVRRASSGEVEVKTASGTVAVGVVDGTAVLLDCSSVTGAVRSELTPSGEPSDESAQHLRLTARSVSGAINIKKSN